MKRGVLGGEIIKAIRNCPIDPAFVAEMINGKLTLTLDDPAFEQLGDGIWSQGCDLEDDVEHEDGVFDERTCRICGCTDDHACPGGCYWVEKDLCSQCQENQSKLKGLLGMDTMGAGEKVK